MPPVQQQTVSRILLGVLGVLVVAVALRRAAPVPEPPATITFGTAWDTDELRHRAFRVEREAPIDVAVVGSFGARAADERGDQLAAFGWIVRRSDGEVVWQMAPDAAERLKGDGGTLAQVTDRLTLAPGLYDAYFTTYGFDEDDHFFSRAPWKTDDEDWRFRLDDGAAGTLTDLTGDTDYAEAAGRATGPEVIYHTGPVPRRTERAAYFRVTAPTAVRLQSVGEVPRSGRAGSELQDYAFLQDVYSGQPVWEMTRPATEPAGGHPRNRRADVTLTLPPGLYRAGFRTDGGHGPGDWWMAPPLDPLGWGLTLRYADPAAAAAGTIAQADLSQLPVVASLAPLGDDERRATRFSVQDSLRVLALGLGEMRSSTRYDYAWLVREPGADGEAPVTVWETTYAASEPAGGESRNRRTEAALTLAPGTYTLHAQTDDSHSADGWHDTAPHDAEHWGATLFAFNPDYAGSPATEIRADRADEPVTWTVPSPGPPPPPEPASPPPAAQPLAQPAPPAVAPRLQALPVRLLASKANERLAAAFELKDPRRLRVTALGELSLSGRYDYGWIERLENGQPVERVWEMSMDDAVYAGGMRRNRVVETELDLPAGRYAARYQTDASHDPSAFVPDGAPDQPERYGLTVEIID